MILLNLHRCESLEYQCLTGGAEEGKRKGDLTWSRDYEVKTSTEFNQLDNKTGTCEKITRGLQRQSGLETTELVCI